MNLLRKLICRIRGEYTTERLIAMGMKVGRNFNRQEGVILDPSHCWLIDIGDNVTIAPRVHILCHDASTKMYLGYTKIGRVNIGNNVFIGANTVILPNVNIGDNVIIGANSTVTHSIPCNSVAAGSPARLISSIEEYIAKEKQLFLICPHYNDEYTLRKNVSSSMKIEQKDDLQNNIGFIE